MRLKCIQVNSCQAFPRLQNRRRVFCVIAIGFVRRERKDDPYCDEQEPGEDGAENKAEEKTEEFVGPYHLHFHVVVTEMERAEGIAIVEMGGRCNFVELPLGLDLVYP